MNRDDNVLFGALALQTGLIDSEQFTESCKLWKSRSDQSLRDVLVERGWLSPDDANHLQYLHERTLDRHQGDVRSTLNALPSVLRKCLAALEILDSEKTVAAPAAAANAESQRVAGTPASANRYEFKSLHASGGIGRIWVARDLQLDRDVALKELLPERTGNNKASARFLREARLTGQLEHPGIVPVYELAFRGDTNEPFYTMRLVRGRTLASAIDAYHAKRSEGRTETLEFVDLLTAFVAVCNTIAYAHSRGILHRDLKGENVILGNFGEVIVLDWGVAKFMGQTDETVERSDLDETQDPHLTIQGEIVGTPAYMAPEQAEGRLEQIDERTDIFGLGAILYAILTGRPPFVGSSTLQVLMAAIRAQPTPPRELVPDVPEAVEEICLKAMAKVPADRYASATELAQEVQRWQEVQRRQAEDALRQQSEILRSILDGMSEGVIVADAAGNLILINPAAERMLGRPAEPTLDATQRTSEYYRSDQVTRLGADELPTARAIRGEEVDDAEMFVRPRHATGGIWVSASARPLRDPAGGVRGGVVVFRDITERKRSEAELLRSRERFELAVRGSQDGLWDWDPQSGEIYYSPRWKSILGYEDHEIASRIEEWEARLHPDERERVLAANRAHIEGLTTHYEYEYRLRHKDGSYRWILSRGVALRDANGKAYRVAGSHVDITERKRAEEERDRLLTREREARAEAESAREALRASEEQYHTLADLIPGVVWTATPDGSIDYANEYWLTFTGMTLEASLGTGWAARVHPDDTSRVIAHWTEALRTGQPAEVDYRLQRADGVYRWFLAQARPMRDRDGHIVKWFGMLTDVDDQKRGAKALERQVALVRLLHDVTVAAYQAETVEEAMQVAIDQVCAFTGWPIGHVYVLNDRNKRELIPTTLWHCGSTTGFESFVQVTEATPLAVGAGLPGRVLERALPAWIMDVTKDANFPRAKAATNLGVKGAFAFPVPTSAGIVAVLEFFTSEPTEPDEALLSAMEQIGIQLGQVFERKRK